MHVHKNDLGPYNRQNPSLATTNTNHTNNGQSNANGGRFPFFGDGRIHQNKVMAKEYQKTTPNSQPLINQNQKHPRQKRTSQGTDKVVHINP